MNYLKSIYQHSFNINDVKRALEIYFEDFKQNNTWGFFTKKEYQIDFKDATFSIVFDFDLDNDIITQFSLLNKFLIDEDNIEFWLSEDEIIEIENHINNNLN